MIGRRLFYIALVLGWLAAACSEERDGPAGTDASRPGLAKRTAILIEVEGEVRVKRSGEPDWRPAAVGMELATNDKVRTQRDSFATIQFEEGGSMRLEPESLVAVTDLRLEQRNQVPRSTFTLMEGRVEAELDTLDEEGGEFKIKTPSAQAKVVRREVLFQ